jgi:ATP-dependent protease ClpP protease subunit
VKIINVNRPIRSDIWDDDSSRKYVITPAEVSRELKDAKGDDIRLEVNSPGGFIISGLEIYNRIVDYRKKYPKAKVTARVLGMAASMATVVSLSADMIEVNTASVWMVHNALSFVIGDYRDLEKEAVALKGFSQMIASLYAEREKTDKDSQYYRKLMDAETWLFGDEIIDAGFADTTWDGPKDIKAVKDVKIKSAKAEYFKFVSEIKDKEKDLCDYEKLVAVMPSGLNIFNNDNDNKVKKEVKMSVETDEKITQKQVDEAYGRGVADGKKDGKKEMQELVAKVTKYFTNEYPDSIKVLGVKVLNGEEHPAALTGAATVWDAQKETKKSEEAKKETGADVSADKLWKPGPSGKAGYAETEQDFQNEIRRMKSQNGGE